MGTKYGQGMHSSSTFFTGLSDIVPSGGSVRTPLPSGRWLIHADADNMEQTQLNVIGMDDKGYPLLELAYIQCLPHITRRPNDSFVSIAKRQVSGGVTELTERELDMIEEKKLEPGQRRVDNIPLIRELQSALGTYVWVYHKFAASEQPEPVDGRGGITMEAPNREPTQLPAHIRTRVRFQGEEAEQSFSGLRYASGGWNFSEDYARWVRAGSDGGEGPLKLSFIGKDDSGLPLLKLALYSIIFDFGDISINDITVEPSKRPVRKSVPEPFKVLANDSYFYVGKRQMVEGEAVELSEKERYIVEQSTRKPF